MLNAASGPRRGILRPQQFPNELLCRSCETKTPVRTLKITAAALIALGILAFALRGSTASIEYGNGFARDVAAKNIVADRDKTIAQLEEVVKQDVGDPNKQEAAKSAHFRGSLLGADCTSW